jgi:alcohol-forming fatty acyl-CoA reductase
LVFEFHEDSRRFCLISTEKMFQRIMTEKPEVMEKIMPVYGDITHENFNLNSDHLAKVIGKTEIFFHIAASVRLIAPLKTNVIINLVGTKNALKLAKQMKSLVQMIHVSTAFCNVELEAADEKVYDIEHDPEDLIRMSEFMDEEVMSAMQKELMGPHPNTYTYTLSFLSASLDHR